MVLSYFFTASRSGIIERHVDLDFVDRELLPRRGAGLPGVNRVRHQDAADLFPVAEQGVAQLFAARIIVRPSILISRLLSAST